ncbi:Na+/H+ antiporter NhaA [Trebonia kvetii]|uniref:Na(+)/H(+) antiporter NhaA n=1 Tax=Trebonia kvetii TaxID=2480626 RepID=A0A6P2BVG0_9ACTN|nr:Na+/H+ antiporter NhaA [Trebonia kvetii]TVZ03044.1 Na+/H+ antiporter NhaA [Trebonia kvetii]
MTEPQQASDERAGTVRQASPDLPGNDPGTGSGTAPPAPTSTAWTSSGRTPLRNFLRTETGSATILALATLAALIWVNVAGGSYDRLWATELSGRVAGHAITMNLHEFVNSGLMALFFLVVGLEARREWDMGELRVRSRLALPFCVGVGGMVVPIAIFLAINAGRPTAHGWGAAASTDTAFALGALALAGGSRLPDRVRTYLLTFSVVDDLFGLAIIAVFYSGHVSWLPLLIGGALLATYFVLNRRGFRNPPAYLLIGVGAWVAFFESGVDPIVSGLVIGLLTCAYPAARENLEQASDAFRLFREQPTARLAAEARETVRGAISPNERLQERYHGMTSYIIVPLFALANADIKISGSFLAHAYTSPATLGIMIGYVAGKPLGTAGIAWLVSKVTKRRLAPPVGWGAVLGVGTVAGIGFTVSLLIASLAFTGNDLAEAKLGVLSGAICATLLTWLVFRGMGRLSPRTRLRALYGTTGTLTDLAVPVDPERDHIRGPREDALVTLVEYGDFECPYCGQAEPAVRGLIREYGELRFVFRHLPLTDVHPHAQLAAEASEAADAQGAFWEMHDALMDHQGALTFSDLIRYARDLGLDTARFTTDLRKHSGAYRVAEDVDSADLATVSGTPTFFINGNRYYGAFDLAALKEAVRAAKARAVIGERSAV